MKAPPELCRIEGLCPEVDDFQADILPGLREAKIALHDGDAGPCSALRSHDHPVTFVGAEVNRTG